MLDNILNLIKSQASSVIDNNPDVPADKRQETIQATTSALASGLKDQLNMGNLSNLSHLFSGDSTTATTMNPLTETLKNTVSSKLTQQVGLSAGTANSISGTIVPLIFKLFSQRVNDPDDKGFNLDSLISAFKGDNSLSSLAKGTLESSIGSLFK